MNKYLTIAIYYFKKYLAASFKSNCKINYKGKGVLNYIEIGAIGGLAES